jgi:hypothetical protein
MFQSIITTIVFCLLELNLTSRRAQENNAAEQARLYYSALAHDFFKTTELIMLPSTQLEKVAIEDVQWPPINFLEQGSMDEENTRKSKRDLAEAADIADIFDAEKRSLPIVINKTILKNKEIQLINSEL